MSLMNLAEENQLNKNLDPFNVGDTVKVHVIIREGLEDKEYIQNRTQGFEYLKEMVEQYTPESVSEITGIAAEDIETAARLFAEAETGSIIYCMGITQHTSGTENVVALTNISLLTGNLGIPSGGMNPRLSHYR